MAKRHGTVLVFRPGTPVCKINELLDHPMLRGIIAQDYWIDNEGRTVPFRVEEFDDTRGGPVWYVP